MRLILYILWDLYYDTYPMTQTTYKTYTIRLTMRLILQDLYYIYYKTYTMTLIVWHILQDLYYKTYYETCTIRLIYTIYILKTL